MASPQIDFCHLGAAGQFHSFLCRSCWKLVASGRRVLIRADKPALLAELSRQLWTFPGGFLSHEIIDEAGDADAVGRQSAQVLLSGASGRHGCDALVNLNQQAPEDHLEFQHLIEIIRPEPELTAAARERYKSYIDAGLEPKYHKIDSGP